jgi:hypothetical protein
MESFFLFYWFIYIYIYIKRTGKLRTLGVAVSLEYF